MELIIYAFNEYILYNMSQRCSDCAEHFSDISRKIRVSEKSPIAASTFQVSHFPPSYPFFRSFPLSNVLRFSDFQRF